MNTFKGYLWKLLQEAKKNKTKAIENDKRLGGGGMNYSDADFYALLTTTERRATIEEIRVAYLEMEKK